MLFPYTKCFLDSFHIIKYREIECVWLRSWLSPPPGKCPDFSVQENTAEFAAVNASPLTDIGYVSVPYCSIVVQ